MKDVAARGDLQFQIDARHVRQLGRELVADDVTALSELIKNAYDADATAVTISFSGASEREGGRLLIEDDGNGMTLDDIRNHWMRISTDAKEKTTRSPRFGRMRAGRKGIGRFSVETLGARLTLETTAGDVPEKITVVFDWDNNYTAGVDLTSVGNPYRVDPAPRAAHFTRLTIEGLHNAWSESALREVERAVLLLQPPFPVAEVYTEAGQVGRTDPGFRVSISADGVPLSSEGAGLDDFFDSATAVISGVIDEEGVGTWAVEGQQVPLSDVEVSPERYLLSGPVTFRAFYFVYRRDVIGSIGVRMARDLGNLYGGIRVYRDRLRILPYGESGDDWLRLDELSRRRTILVPIGNNAFFGEVHVSREKNVLLVDTASREGIIENDAFTEIRSFVYNGLVWAAQRVAAVRERKATAGERRQQRPITRAELIRRAIADLTALAQQSRGGTGAVLQDAAQTLAETLENAEAEDRREKRLEEDLVGEIELLRILASLGTSIAVFSHEVRGVVNRMAASLGDVQDLVEDLSVPEKDPLMAELEAAQESLASLDEVGRYIDGYVSQSRVRVKLPQPVASVLEDFFDAFASIMNRRGIKFHVDVEPRHLRTGPMTRSELEAILFNLLTNSIKAMDEEGHDRREISVVARETGSEVVIRFEDTGRGIDPAIQDRVFDPFVTTTAPEQSELGTGTGLGLKIVHDTATTYGGKIAVGKASSGYQTCFVLRFPLWIGG